MSGDIFQPVYDLYIGCVKGTTWGTAVDCDVASRRIPALSENLVMGMEPYANKSLMNSIFERADRQGKVGPVTGGIRSHLDVDNLALPLALIFGTQSAPAQQSGTAGYLSTLTWSNNVKGLFATIALERGIDLEEIASFKFQGMNIEANAGEGVVIDMTGTGDYRGWEGSTPWPATTVGLPGSNLSFKAVDPLPFFMFHADDFKIQINTASGGGLSDSDRVYPDTFNLSAQRTMRIPWTRPPYIGEPIDNGFSIWTGSFNLPLYQSITLQEAYQSRTVMKMAILMRGPLISGSVYYGLNIYLPAVQITEAPANASGEETVQHPISFRAIEGTATPTGMAQAKPYATILNKYTSAII